MEQSDPAIPPPPHAPNSRGLAGIASCGNGWHNACGNSFRRVFAPQYASMQRLNLHQGNLQPEQGCSGSICRRQCFRQSVRPVTPRSSSPRLSRNTKPSYHHHRAIATWSLQKKKKKSSDLDRQSSSEVCSICNLHHQFVIRPPSLSHPTAGSHHFQHVTPEPSSVVAHSTDLDRRFRRRSYSFLSRPVEVDQPNVAWTRGNIIAVPVRLQHLAVAFPVCVPWQPQPLARQVARNVKRSALFGCQETTRRRSRAAAAP